MAEFRPVNLAEIYGQVDAARANQAQMQNNAMMQERQRRQFALEDEELNKKRRMSEAYKNSIDVVDGAPVLNRKKLSQFLLQEDPTAALEVEDKFAQMDATKAKTQAEAKKAELAQKVETSKYFRDRLATATDQASYDAVLMEAEKMGAGFVNGAPRAFNPEWTSKQIYSADDFIKKAENDLNRGVQMRGQDITMRGQDLTRDTTIRGQNLSAATARRGQDITRRGQDLTNARETEKITAKATPPINQGAIDSIDQAKTSLETIINHPGRKAATGKSAILNKLTIPGTDRAGFQARLETFKAQTFVPMVSQLKGMGALSDAEGKKLTAAVGALDPNMPEDEFLASANEIMQELELKKKRALGDNSSTIMRKGEKMPRDVRSEADKILGL